MFPTNYEKRGLWYQAVFKEMVYLDHVQVMITGYLEKWD